jgi:hypothetical protein
MYDYQKPTTAGSSDVSSRLLNGLRKEHSTACTIADQKLRQFDIPLPYFVRISIALVPDVHDMQFLK